MEKELLSVGIGPNVEVNVVMKRKNGDLYSVHLSGTIQPYGHPDFTWVQALEDGLTGSVNTRLKFPNDPKEYDAAFVGIDTGNGGDPVIQFREI